jgi:3-methyladenine DNA glycosylase AlkD
MMPTPRRSSPSIVNAAAQVKRELRRQSRPAGEFDPSRYFRTTEALEFLNVRTPIVRALGRRIAREHRDRWTIDDAVAFTDATMHEAALELKGAGIEALGVRRRELLPRHLAVIKRWLAQGHAANWATTDTLCGTLISPMLVAFPALVAVVASWTAHRNLWVRRAAAVSLVRLAARGQALDVAYGVATALRPDRHDLIHKAAGWLLREAGRTDRRRLEHYLVAHGLAIPRTTLRYAIEHFPPAQRKRLLAATRMRP